MPALHRATAQEDHLPTVRPEYAKQAEQAYLAAKKKLDAAPDNGEAQWQLARATFDWADYATSDDQRAALAQEGINATRKLIATNSSSVPGHYYLGMNLGQLARTKNLGALRLVDQMESEFQISLARDPTLDYAGPDRNLGLLYRDAPGWPMSIGNNSKARRHLESAIKQSREYPDNWLNLIETELKWGEKSAAARELKTFEEILPEARKKFTGTEWNSLWADWDKRHEEVRLTVTAPSKSTKSPRK